MKESIPSKKLDFWITHFCNVLLEGKHGVGKTSAVLEAFKRHNLNYVYFSCSTLDPWVDFVGIPKEFKDEQTGIVYLDLIRPKAFALDEVEVIFLDEMNRAPPKVTNAIMELIQFKSINGKKLNKLKMVWAAINPPPTDNSSPQYHVQELDPAIRTRFQVKYEVPFEIAENYFTAKYGKEVTTKVVNFWDALPTNIKYEFPPREVEHSLDMLNCGGDVNDTLPSCIKKSTFIKALSANSPEPIPVASKTLSGINQNVNFINADKNTLNKLSRDGTAFKKQLKQLSNEEFLQMFSTHAQTTSNTVSIIGQRMLQYGTDAQIQCTTKLACTDLDFEKAVHRVLWRVCANRGLHIDGMVMDEDEYF